MVIIPENVPLAALPHCKPATDAMDGAKCNADPIEGVQAATIDPGVLLDARVSLFAKCKATRPAKSLPLGEFFAAVKEATGAVKLSAFARRTGPAKKRQTG